VFLRVSKVKKNKKTYSYAQLVESYRRKEDGLPAHRVVANLGQLSELEVANLKTALSAAKENKMVGIHRKVSSTKISKPVANLKYLDLVVLKSIWENFKVHTLLRESLPKSNALVSSADIISVLCLHRCTAPGSKLSAVRWYKTTCLAEIFNIDHSSFNNSRIHRAMYDLEQSRQSIMARLPSLYENKKSDMSVMYLDVSNAWFCGVGPELAQKGLGKDGAIRRQIGIVLLCNNDGFPVRWEVVPGASVDKITMLKTLEEINHLNWSKDIPLVCDRAMGQSSSIRTMHQLGIKYLTALTRHEYTNYGAALASKKVHIDIKDLSEEDITIEAKRVIEKSEDFVKVADDMYVIDLGQISITAFNEGDDRSFMKKEVGNSVRLAMQLGQRIKALVTSQKFGSIMASGASLGMKPSLSQKYFNLTKLPDQVQQDILEGKANNCSINTIEQIAIKEKPERMFDKFYEHLKQRNKVPPRMRRKFIRDDVKECEESSKPGIINIRVVAYFNPQMYADQKNRARKWLEKINEFEIDLNRRLKSPANRRGRDSIAAEIDRFIRKKDLIRCFDIKIQKEKIEKKNPWQVAIKLDQEKWDKRGDFDGFCILANHPECKLSAVDICRLYRRKDLVEKDFQTIKNILHLRPIRHRQDDKVQAHVSICMLSLLLERLLEKSLNHEHTAKTVLDQLNTCHLNKYEVSNKSLYTITKVDKDQASILKSLKLTKLGDDAYLNERISQR
jgi:transposase